MLKSYILGFYYKYVSWLYPNQFQQSFKAVDGGLAASGFDAGGEQAFFEQLACEAGGGGLNPQDPEPSLRDTSIQHLLSVLHFGTHFPEPEKHAAGRQG